VQVLAKFMSTPEGNWEALVAAGRGSLGRDFFAHMENLVRASSDDNAKRDGAPLPSFPLLTIDMVENASRETSKLPN
jgi:hypothetical protein